MDAIAKLTCKQQPLLFLNHHNHHYHNRPSFSSISFKSQSFRPSISSSIKIKIKSSSSFSPSLSLSSNPKPAQNPQNSHPLSPLFSLLKIPLCVTVAATALFFSGFGHRPLLAIAAPVAESSADTTAASEEDAVSEEERERLLEEQVASNPDDVQSLKTLMEVKIKNKKLPEAVEVINRLIELDPNDVEWYILRAHMYSYMGETELAKAGFEEILAKDPVRVEAFHGLVMAVSQGEESGGGELDGVTKRIQEAMEVCRKEKKKDDMRDFKLLIAQIRVIEGKYSEALKIYQELVKEEPRDFRPYLCQGIIYTLLRKKDEADKQFELYKRLVPQGHPYARFFDDNMLATKVFSQMAENERMKAGSKA